MSTFDPAAFLTPAELALYEQATADVAARRAQEAEQQRMYEAAALATQAQQLVEDGELTNSEAASLLLQQNPDAASMFTAVWEQTERAERISDLAADLHDADFESWQAVLETAAVERQEQLEAQAAELQDKIIAKQVLSASDALHAYLGTVPEAHNFAGRMNEIISKALADKIEADEPLPTTPEENQELIDSTYRTLTVADRIHEEAAEQARTEQRIRQRPSVERGRTSGDQTAEQKAAADKAWLEERTAELVAAKGGEVAQSGALDERGAVRSPNTGEQERVAQLERITKAGPSLAAGGFNAAAYKDAPTLADEVSGRAKRPAVDHYAGRKAEKDELHEKMQAAENAANFGDFAIKTGYAGSSPDAAVVDEQSSLPPSS